MKFVKADDQEEKSMFQRIVSEDGTIEIGIHPVMFGFRVVGGYTKSQWYEIDWCGGSDQSQVELLYSIAKNILENKGTFEGLPNCSRVKPFYNDREFVDCVNFLVTILFDFVEVMFLHFFYTIKFE